MMLGFFAASEALNQLLNFITVGVGSAIGGVKQFHPHIASQFDIRLPIAQVGEVWGDVLDFGRPPNPYWPWRNTSNRAICYR